MSNQKFLLLIYILVNLPLFGLERVLVLPPAYSPEKKDYALQVIDEFQKIVLLNKRFQLVSESEKQVNLEELSTKRIVPVLREFQKVGIACRAAKVFYLECLNANDQVEYLVSFYDTQNGKLVYQQKSVTAHSPENLASSIYSSIQENSMRRQEYISMLVTLRLTQVDVDAIENSGGTISGALALHKLGISIDDYRFILQLGGNALEFEMLLKSSKIDSVNDQLKQTAYYVMFLSQKYRANL